MLAIEAASGSRKRNARSQPPYRSDKEHQQDILLTDPLLIADRQLPRSQPEQEWWLWSDILL